jgi:hypothetical protein
MGTPPLGAPPDAPVPSAELIAEATDAIRDMLEEVAAIGEEDDEGEEGGRGEVRRREGFEVFCACGTVCQFI